MTTAAEKIQPKHDEKKRSSQLDLIRILAMCAVVLIHVFSLTGADKLSDGVKFVYSLIPALCRWAVPCFVMVSGAILLAREETYSKIFIRCRRLLLALLIFGIPMALLENIFNGKTIPAALLQSVLDIIAGRSWDVLWYLYMMIGLYLLMPLMQKSLKKMDNRQFWTTAIILFAFTSVIPYINSFFANDVIGFYLPVNSVFFLYALLGYGIFNRIERASIRRMLIPSLSVAAACFGIIVLLLCFEINTDLNSSNPIIVILSCAVFTALLSVKTNASKALSYIGKRSFGVYLIHCFVVNFIYKFLHMYPYNYPLIISIPVAFIVITAISFAASAILYKIPFVRKYVL